MIITRDVINKEIIFVDYKKGTEGKYYSYNDVSKKVDFFKNYLMHIGAKKGESVLIGYAPSIDQIGLFLAVCELGLNFIVNDYKTIDNDKFDFIDTKTKILSPINYFFDYGNFYEKKRDYFKKISNNYIEWTDIESYDCFDSNNTIWATPNDILMKCTSSGTTGTPKKVTHSHEFLYNISKRNTVFFDGNVSLVYNFNHGSSLATYFIPALMSNNTVKFCNIFAEVLTDKDKTKTIFENIDHVMIPYSNQLNEVITMHDLPNMTYYTLSSIAEEFRDKDKRKRYKDIVSFFGCNETSGPIFINRASYDDFETPVYRLLDDYYEIKSFNPLIVRLKEYDIEINTKDIFKKQKNGFKFEGRSDLLRINGLPITEIYSWYLRNFKGYADFVYDTVYNKIYIAMWISDEWIKENPDRYPGILKEINMINDVLIYRTNGKHRISKVANLNRDDFVTGVKLDQEFLRSYFREKVEEYA